MPFTVAMLSELQSDVSATVRLWRLAKPAGGITLADVYLALDERLVSGGDSDAEPSYCSIETGLQTRVAEVLEEIEDSLVQRLRETSITDVHPKSCSYCDS